MRHSLLIIGLAAGAVACGGAPGTTGGAAAPAKSGDRQALVAKIDSIISQPITAGKVAGASIAIVKGKDTIAVQGFGKANIELDVPTMAHATYEIGSVTKQFTAAALLQLVEQGKVNLDVTSPNICRVTTVRATRFRSAGCSTTPRGSRATPRFPSSDRSVPSSSPATPWSSSSPRSRSTSIRVTRRSTTTRPSSSPA